ncbi:MAG: ATP-binding protein [Ktedonobacteraceae bacterium]|nr:ATP-binding protein [Ktedonobacteraceae bacterium]
MERLNNNLHNVVGRVSSQRRYQNEPRPTPNTTEQDTQHMPSAPQRRPLPEQRAHLGERNSYTSKHQAYTHTNSSKKTQNFSVQEGSDNYYTDRSRRTPSNMPSSPAGYLQSGEYGYPSRMNQPPTVDEAYEYPSVPARPQTRSRAMIHHSDDFGPVPSADAMQGWEDETEDIAGMRDDDWEEGLMMNAPASRPPYRYAEAIVKYSQAQYAAQLRDVTRVEEINNMGEVARSRATRQVEPRPSVPARATPSTPPPSSAQRSPLAPARTQIAGRTQQRNTQPLNSRIPIDPRQAREYPERPSVQSAPQQSRPVPAVREPLLPYVLPATPAPVSQKSVCPKCKGAGYLRANVPFGHPNFGRPIPCECKETERKDKRRQQLRDISNLDAFRDRTFRTFNSRVPGVQEAYEVSRDYAQEPEGWLLLVGPNGCGKTHLAAAIANQCLEDGAVVLFQVVPDLLDHLRAAFAPNATEVFDQLFSKMREAEVLILDDLGSQQSSPWANEKLFQLLNYRYNMGMPTVITANPKGLQGVDERIRSRLTDVSLVEQVNFDRARDYRPHHPRRD